jgi:RimJ/RimL family protein N-acetyltransferase
MSIEEKTAPADPFVAKEGHAFDCTGVEVVSERLRLLPISEEYAEEIYRNFTPEVTCYMSPKSPNHIGETLEFIHRSLRGMRRGEDLQFVITLQESGEFLGCGGLHGYDNPKTPELGIWLKIAAHGNGYGKEAIFALKQWADQHLAYKYLTYPVDRENVPSRKIPEALGGEIFEETLSPTQDGRVLDIVVYRIYSSQ